jgi:hypothetical protein
MNLTEGGNAIPDSIPVLKQYIGPVVRKAISLLPPELQSAVQTDIGSAGYKAESGDIDVFVDANAVIDYFKTQNDKKSPETAAKKALQAHFQSKGLEAVVKGRNVHVGVPFPSGIAQVDFMVIADSKEVAPWHQHGPRGMYNEPDFKGNAIFILLNSVGKPLGLKFDAFGGKLLRRDNNEIVARSRDDVAKILLNPQATGNDLNSVKSIMNALRNDPRREEKLAQAKDDVAKGLITLPESIQEGSVAWFSAVKALLTK